MVTNEYIKFVNDKIVVNGKDFLKVCAHRFDWFLSDNVSAEIPEKFNLENLPAKQEYDRIMLELKEWQTIDFQEAKSRLINERVSKNCERVDRIHALKDFLNLYNKIKAEIEQYKAPNDSCEKIKSFALLVLKEAIDDIEDSIKIYESHPLEPIKYSDEDVYTYIRDKLDHLVQQMLYYKNRYLKYENQLKESNEILTQFSDSLKKMK